MFINPYKAYLHVTNNLVENGPTRGAAENVKMRWGGRTQSMGRQPRMASACPLFEYFLQIDRVFV